jgi:hypothetical protein
MIFILWPLVRTSIHSFVAMISLLKLYSCLLLFLSLPLVSALKFDVAAHRGHESAKHERCIRNFVAKDQLVVVTVIVDGNRGDGQQLNMHVSWLLPFAFMTNQG